MVQQVINVGAEANDGTGDPLRTAMVKTNQNFTELYLTTASSYNATNAAFDRANSAIGGGTPSDPGILVFTVYDHANAAYRVANAAFDTANLAFGQANTAYVIGNLSFGTANTARSEINALAELLANTSNTVNTLALYTYVYTGGSANGEGGALGNTNNIAIAAFNTANAAFETANLGGGGGSSSANLENIINISANTQSNTIIFHGTTFGFSTDTPQNYEPDWMAITLGGIDNRFPGSPGRWGDLIWQGKNNEYIADFYSWNESLNDRFVMYFNANATFSLDDTNKSFEFSGGKTQFSNPVGIYRDNPGTYALDVFGTINAANILVNGAPISGAAPSANLENIRNISANTQSNTIIFHGSVFGFGTDNPEDYQPNYTTLVLGGKDSRFPGQPGKHGDFIIKNKDDAYTGEFYVDSSSSNSIISYAIRDFSILTGSGSLILEPGVNVYSMKSVGIYRYPGPYALDVNGTINASAVLVNGSPIAGGASFDKANSANILAYYANVNAAAAFATANIAIANVNYVNTAMVSAFATANIANATANYAATKANTWLLSSNVAPVSAVANSFWFNTDTAELYVYFQDWDGTTQWVQVNGSLGAGQALKDVGYYSMFFYPGYVDANVTMYINNAPTKYYLPANLTGSYATVETAPSGNNANLRISKNGVYIGNIAFARNNTNATFVFANTVTFEPGDKLRITSPVSVDPTMTDIAVSLVGVKVVS